MSEKKAVYLTEEQIAVVESIKRNSEERDGMWDMGYSEVIRELVDYAIEHLDEKPALEELVDEIDRVMWENQQRHEARRKKAKFADMAGGWRGRVRSYLNQRLAGTEPHPPDKVEILAESYVGDVIDWERDPETLEQNWDRIEEHREWLDDMIDEYRDAYEAKSVLPDEAFENHDDVETGADLLRLRDNFEDVILDIAEAADGTGFDVDAIYRKLAGDYAVEEETVELVVEKLTGDDVDARRALKSGEGILDAVDRQALTAWGGDPEKLPGGVDVEDGGDDDRPDDGEESEEAHTPQGETEDGEESANSDADAVEVVETVTDGGDHAGGLDPEDLTTEEAIETAVDVIEAGEDPSTSIEVRRVTSSEAERDAAVVAARERLADAEEDVVDVDTVAATDGGEAGE